MCVFSGCLGSIFRKATFFSFLSIFLFIQPAHAQTPACSVAGNAGNSYETCTSGVCENFICNGSAYVTVSSRAFAGWESTKFGNDTQTCNSARSGRLRYAGGSTWEYCNGTAWSAFGGGGSVTWPQSIAAGGSIFRYQTGPVLTKNLMGFSTDTGKTSSFFGYEAGENATALSNNTFIGYQTGLNTTSAGNVFLGSASGSANTSGANNVFLGYNAGLVNTTGSNNTFVGTNAGVSTTTTSNVTYIGYNVGSGQIGSDNIAIGPNASFSGPGTSEYLNIGNAIYGTLNDGDGTFARGDNDSAIVIDGSVQVGTSAAACGAGNAGTIRYNAPNMQLIGRRLYQDLPPIRT